MYCFQNITNYTCYNCFRRKKFFKIKINKILFKINYVTRKIKCEFGYQWKMKIILLFSLFLLLFMGPTAFFGTIYGPHCTISVKFYFYLQYFQQ